MKRMTRKEAQSQGYIYFSDEIRTLAQKTIVADKNMVEIFSPLEAEMLQMLENCLCDDMADPAKEILSLIKKARGER